jgi:hypothetical protein
MLPISKEKKWLQLQEIKKSIPLFLKGPAKEAGVLKPAR